MKIFLFTMGVLLLLLMTVTSYALTSFNYTGIAFDGSGNILTSTTVNVEIELVEASSSKYKETHSGVTTNQFGTYTVEVGSGIVVSGNLATASASKDLRIKSTITGGSGGVWVTSSVLKPTVALTALSGEMNWKTVGTKGTSSGTDFVATNDNTELEFRVKDNAGTYFNSLFIGTKNELWRNGSGSTVSGNPRGVHAIDLQAVRTSSNRIASGDYSVLGGGRQSRAEGNYAVNSGGRSNRRAGDYAALGGGRGNRAVLENTVIAGGERSSANNYAANTFASGVFDNTGDAQAVLYVVRNETADGTATDLFIDGSSQRMTLDEGDVWTFEALVIGKSDNFTHYAAYIVTGIITNDGGVTTVSGLNTSVISESSTSYNATATHTGHNLVIRVTGDATNTMRWVARVTITDVHF
jgi:hypothetical protein